MIKNGRVEVGKTPSEISGKDSTKIVSGIPLAAGEEREESPFEKVAADLVGKERLLRAVGEELILLKNKKDSSCRK